VRAAATGSPAVIDAAAAPDALPGAGTAVVGRERVADRRSGGCGGAVVCLYSERAAANCSMFGRPKSEYAKPLSDSINDYGANTVEAARVTRSVTGLLREAAAFRATYVVAGGRLVHPALLGARSPPFHRIEWEAMAGIWDESQP